MISFIIHISAANAAFVNFINEFALAVIVSVLPPMHILHDRRIRPSLPQPVDHTQHIRILLPPADVLKDLTYRLVLVCYFDLEFPLTDLKFCRSLAFPDCLYDERIPFYDLLYPLFRHDNLSSAFV